MKIFKKSEQVVCIDISNTKYLTIGQTYNILNIQTTSFGHSIWICNDAGSTFAYDSNLFLSTIEHRNKTIDDILSYD